MREIKFRGLGVDGKWWFGELNPSGENHVNLATFFANLHVGAIRPETIGEFTGLHDKNGKEIYEGDILATKNQYGKNDLVGQIGWIEKEARFSTVYPLTRFEIIGNQWETPELLEP